MKKYKVKLNTEDIMLLWVSIPMTLRWLTPYDLGVLGDIEEESILSLTNKFRDIILSEEFQGITIEKEFTLELNRSEFDLLIRLPNNAYSSGSLKSLESLRSRVSNIDIRFNLKS